MRNRSRMSLSDQLRGVKLKQADFILTPLSVFWDKGRKELEDFARGCKVPSISGASPSTGTSSHSPTSSSG